MREARDLQCNLYEIYNTCASGNCTQMYHVFYLNIYIYIDQSQFIGWNCLICQHLL